MFQTLTGAQAEAGGNADGSQRSGLSARQA